jgi:hypothetical protein
VTRPLSGCLTRIRRHCKRIGARHRPNGANRPIYQRS